MAMPIVAVGPSLGFKTLADFTHDQMHGAQHVGQHMVRLNFQVVGFELNLYMPITQMVGGANQIVGCATFAAIGDVQQFLWRSNDLDKRAVLGHQHVATPYNCTARQKYTQLPVR